jgi:chromosome partitioning protein
MLICHVAPYYRPTNRPVTRSYRLTGVTIISVCSSKGGVSKSVINMVMSGTLAAMGYKVAVIDADPNACFINWHKLYEGAPIDCTAEIQQDAIVDHAQAKATEYDVVMIDTAGFGNTTAAFAAGTADFVIVPVMPDRSSAVEAMRTIRQVKAFAKASRRDIPLAMLCSRWNGRGLVERAVLSDLQSSGHTVLSSYLSDLSDFGKMTLSGRVPLSGKVSLQVRKIIKELMALKAIPAKPTKRAV